jgi:hypothetical protein
MSFRTPVVATRAGTLHIYIDRSNEVLIETFYSLTAYSPCVQPAAAFLVKRLVILTDIHHFDA